MLLTWPLTSFLLQLRRPQEKLFGGSGARESLSECGFAGWVGVARRVGVARNMNRNVLVRRRRRPVLVNAC